MVAQVAGPVHEGLHVVRVGAEEKPVARGAVAETPCKVEASRLDFHSTVIRHGVVGHFGARHRASVDFHRPFIARRGSHEVISAWSDGHVSDANGSRIVCESGLWNEVLLANRNFIKATGAVVANRGTIYGLSIEINAFPFTLRNVVNTHQEVTTVVGVRGVEVDGHLSSTIRVYNVKRALVDDGAVFLRFVSINGGVIHFHKVHLRCSGRSIRDILVRSIELEAADAAASHFLQVFGRDDKLALSEFIKI